MAPLIIMVAAFGCGDACQRLCQSVGDRLDRCIDGRSAIAWIDVRAKNRDDFVDLCEQEWDDERRQLSSFDRTAALQQCCDTVPLFQPGGQGALGCDDATPVLTCDEVVALYGNLP